MASAGDKPNNPNANLGPLQDNGGPTWTSALLAGSTAIDAIPVADCTDLDGIPMIIDQRGFARPVDGNGDGDVRCDMGPYEVQVARVGGTTSFLTDGSGSSFGSVALLAGGIAAVVIIATAGGWYARRRWLRTES